MTKPLPQSMGNHLQNSRQARIITKLLNPKFTLSVGAQALVSGFHFFLNLVLLRTLDQYQYGVFAFAFVLGMFALAINNALISTPLTVYTPVIKDPEEKREQEWMLGTANLLFFIALCICGFLYGVTTELPAGTIAGATFFVAMYAARHFSRSSGYARLKPLVTALGDLTYVAFGTLLIALLMFSTYSITVGLVLLTLGLASFLAILTERYLLHRNSAFRFNLQLLKNYPHIWEQSRWALLGALTTLFMSQAHSVIITSTKGPAAFAPLAAGFVMFGPVRVALLTWQNLVKPELAVALSENKTMEVHRQIRRSVLLMAASVLAMSVLLYLCWPWIAHFLYEKKYAEEPMGLIVGFWASITLFAAIANAPSAALQALREFKVLAYASVYGSMISLILVTVLLVYFSAEYTLVGIMLAELFVAVFLISVASRKLQSSGRSAFTGESA